VFFPDVVAELVQRYRFQKFPTQFSELDEIKGIEFIEGKAGNEVIERLVIFSNGILLDTRSNTRISVEIIDEALGWAKEKFGIAYERGMIRRFGYVSQVTFHSEASLLTLNPALTRLADRVTSAVSEFQMERVEFQAMALLVQHDPLKRKNPLASFTISPRIEVPHSEKKYFSEAPLPTDLHWELLEEFEAGLLSQK
jgi:hypothetical protein